MREKESSGSGLSESRCSFLLRAFESGRRERDKDKERKKERQRQREREGRLEEERDKRGGTHSVSFEEDIQVLVGLAVLLLAQGTLVDRVLPVRLRTVAAIKAFLSQRLNSFPKAGVGRGGGGGGRGVEQVYRTAADSPANSQHLLTVPRHPAETTRDTSNAIIHRSSSNQPSTMVKSTLA